MDAVTARRTSAHDSMFMSCLHLPHADLHIVQNPCSHAFEVDVVRLKDDLLSKFAGQCEEGCLLFGELFGSEDTCWSVEM